MSYRPESASEATSSSNKARVGRLIAVPVLATAVALAASACSSGEKSPAPAKSEAAPRPTPTGLTPELQKRAESSMQNLARTASLAVLAEMQRPNVGTVSYVYNGDKIIGNKAAIVAPGPDGKLGTSDDTGTSGHEHTPEMLAGYYPSNHRLTVYSYGSVPQNGQETFSNVDVVYTVGENSPIARQTGPLSIADVERAVQDNNGLSVLAMDSGNRWGYNKKTKQETGDRSGLVIDSGKLYNNDTGEAAFAMDPSWIPYPSDQITAPEAAVMEVDKLDADATGALFDLDFLANNVLPPNPFQSPS